jgi:hypothetical protein
MSDKVLPVCRRTKWLCHFPDFPNAKLCAPLEISSSTIIVIALEHGEAIFTTSSHLGAKCEIHAFRHRIGFFLTSLRSNISCPLAPNFEPKVKHGPSARSIRSDDT